ncbi:hypothetical protein [Fructilactobacillus carniphilus]|uniref:Uncharacterized protein n=1 Tax=Fructilactobacillus carniphilus TaxID=2940297 RepID=A0ABY5BYW2_9LACO|nr:hypothetical protein [Fructilactobacillus carniphilus]USS90286.1 hypothetical protein M3M37_05435 [Fructilactobacillus carniphilus]
MEDKTELSLEEKEGRLKYINKVIDDGESQLRDVKKYQMELSERLINLAQKNDLMASNEFKKGYNEAMEILDDRNYEIKRALKYVYEEQYYLKKEINKNKN